MKRYRIFALMLVLIVIAACTPQKEYRTVVEKDKSGYSYETVENDPLGLRIYTLKNGLKVYLAINKDEPRISTFIAVKAGSTYDPSETTGLAHYLEHMLFKGSDDIGTLDWQAEEPLLKEISDLFELHKQTQDPKEKKMIYAKIDSVSLLASKYAIANEYDKMCSAIGAQGTNAYTSDERTVYMNDIAANELEKWCLLESERFSKLVLRLFHTELETVYEEFNMYQDYDESRASEKLMAALFPKHPYGQQTTIGKAEHLKNPSMVNIHNYFEKFYVPNNMAICLAGDIDPEETIKMIEKYFGEFKPNNDLGKIEHPKEEPMTKPVELTVKGPKAEFVNFAFRFNGIGSDDEKYVDIIDMILNNNSAGLIDLNLVKNQKVLQAYTYSGFMKDYGMHWFAGYPREGQTLEQVRDLLLGEIEKIKKGEFDEWLIQAVVNDLRLQRIRGFESRNVAHTFAAKFAEGVNWEDYLRELDEIEKIKKQDIVNFAKKHYNNNYVLVYKRTGVDPDIVKVEKPKITPLDVNRTDESDFLTKFKNVSAGNIEPVFVDFKNSIAAEQFEAGIDFHSIKNVTNELFSLSYIIDMGNEHHKMLPIAVNFAPYIGTDKYSLEELNRELYKLGISFGVSTGDRRSYIYISGLDKNFEKGVELLEHILSSFKPDQKAYDEYVKGIAKNRVDNKLDKSYILWDALYNWGKYGENSSFRDIYSNDELKGLKPEQLTDLLKDLFNYKHKIFYYGPRSAESAQSIVEKNHKPKLPLKDYPERKIYTELDYEKSQVLFADYDMVQTNIVMLAKDSPYNIKLLPISRLFNEYYGNSMASIVFQEIREAKGLAYSAYAAYSTPYYTDNSNYIFGFVGTQPDKLKIATDAMLGLLDTMPEAQTLLGHAKDNIIKTIESERIIKQSIYWTYLRNLDRGIDYDYRKDIYTAVKDMGMNELKSFFESNVKGKQYIYMIIANKKLIDWNVLKSLGEVSEIPLEKLFNY